MASSSSSLIRFFLLMILLMILFTTPKSLNARTLKNVPQHAHALLIRDNRFKGTYKKSNSSQDSSPTGEGRPSGYVLVPPPSTNTSLAYDSANYSTCKAAASATTNASAGASSTTSSGAKCTAGVGNQNVDSANNSTACKAVTSASAHSSGGGSSSVSSVSSCSTGIGNQNRQIKFNSPPVSQGNVPFLFPSGFP